MNTSSSGRTGLLHRWRECREKTPSASPPASAEGCRLAHVDIDLDALWRVRDEDDGWMTRPAVQVRQAAHWGR